MSYNIFLNDFENMDTPLLRTFYPVRRVSGFNSFHCTSDKSGFITLATGDMKRTKRSGPRTEPWGTPVDIVVQDDDDESILTKDVQFVR